MKAAKQAEVDKFNKEIKAAREKEGKYSKGRQLRRLSDDEMDAEATAKARYIKVNAKGHVDNKSLRIGFKKADDDIVKGKNTYVNMADGEDV